jgi:lactoylglutathione lyase
MSVDDRIVFNGDPSAPGDGSVHPEGAAVSTAQVFKRLDHVGIMVVDIDRAVAWYRSALGLEIVDRWSDAASGMSWAHLAAGGLTIELVTRPGLTEPAPGPAGYHHVALVVDDCAATTSALAAAGGTVVMAPSVFDRHAMIWSFVADPFGTIFELVQYLEPDPGRP